VGIGFLIVADLLLAAAHSVPMVVGGALFCGLHMAATQGLLTTIIADAAPPNLRGTAFGLFNRSPGWRC
jgi:MFS family permease